AREGSVRAAGELRLVVHLRMTGRLMTWPVDAAPGPYTRCVFDLACPGKGPEGASRLFFDDVRAFGQVLACAPDTLRQWPFWRELGPEPLEMEEMDFAARLVGKNAALKAVLLDQKVVAGVGNIYADESLFAARLDPRRKASTLTEAQCARLLRCLRDVLRRSIEQCGSSIRDYRDADGNVGAFQNSFAVYGRGGQPCRSCGRRLRKLRVAGRTTVCCSHCQK
ncbi:MAG: bifunctional DNA-formamidopyrimidine glycosylase/DNA-(apurinic or apyrimidinic site) lyase, partial [Desulfovibrio sp.]|nr:bifunctional DNA-formamidopyrimidine glycosylase/DNA-(apurinic or apyrimidinic site) lyase [Desulfovibrio sp.]